MNALRQPRTLKKGDTIGLIATAKKISHEEVQFAVKLIESWGLHVKLGETLSFAENQFAGNDSQRTADFQKMMDDDKIDAILCARGGYGTVRIIDGLDFTKYLRNPKWICGYSDITVLHCHLNYALGIQSIHSSMPINFETNSQEALESLRMALFNEPISYVIPSYPLNILGETTSVITGGNLSVLYSLSGTNTVFNNMNHILFLEDLDEYLYHIDRMLMNLKRGSKFKSIAAVIIGAFSDMKDNQIPFGKDAYGILNDYTSKLGIPVCFNFPAGHIQDNRTLIFGKKAHLKVEEMSSTLTFI